METSVVPAMLLCPVKLWKIVGRMHPTKFRQNLRVFWKLMNLWDCVWEIQYQIIMKTILQDKEIIHYSITIGFINLFLCLMLWKLLQQMQWWTRNGKNWRKFRRGTWRKCVNINAFVPGYSSCLCGNCGSSKWRRVFTWTAVEVLCLSELRKLERFKHTLVVRDVTTSVAHLRICASAPSLFASVSLWSVRLRWVALSIAVGLRRSRHVLPTTVLTASHSFFLLSLVTRTWSHSQRIRVGSRYRAGEKTRCMVAELGSCPRYNTQTC